MRDLKLILLIRRACNANELEDSWQTSGLSSSVQPSKKAKIAPWSLTYKKEKSNTSVHDTSFHPKKKIS